MQQTQQECPTIGSISREMLENFTKRELKDGFEFWDLNEDIDWQHNIVIEAYHNRMLCPEAYSTIFKILIEIYIASNEEQAEDFLYDIEPYSNVPELTNWLNSSSDNLNYLNMALKYSHSDDAHTLLTDAHRLFLQDIGSNLIKAIKQYISKQAMYANSLSETSERRD